MAENIELCIKIDGIEMAPVTMDGPKEIQHFENQIQFSFQGHILDKAGKKAAYEALIQLYRNRKPGELKAENH